MIAACLVLGLCISVIVLLLVDHHSLKGGNRTLFTLSIFALLVLAAYGIGLIVKTETEKQTPQFEKIETPVYKRVN